MGRRSVASATISFGLVTIPVKFYLSANAENVHFCLLDKNGGKVHQQYVNDDGEVVERAEMSRGYVVDKQTTVIFTKDEIKQLEETGSGSIEISEFVAASEVDLLHVEKSYQLSPGKGGDKAYILLIKALLKSGRYAVGQWVARGKQHLVIIRPYKDGLVLHQMFYADEIRDFESDCAKVQVKDAEIDLACKLIDVQTSTSYDPSKYKDSFKERVAQAVETKLAGKTVTVNIEPQATKVTDLFEALKASLEKANKSA